VRCAAAGFAVAAPSLSLVGAPAADSARGRTERVKPKTTLSSCLALFSLSNTSQREY